MGLGRTDLQLLIRLKAEKWLDPPLAVMEIGAQQLSYSFLDARDLIDEIGKIFKVDKPCPLPAPPRTMAAPDETGALDGDAPAARAFWKWLGFDYAAIDIDGSADSIPLDLNYDHAPRAAKGKYHLVTNYGTTEHVANQVNAFKIVHDLTTPGGLMIHNLPMQGMLNHGFVNYNPKFFWLLGRSNGYRIVYMSLSADVAGKKLPQDILDYLGQYEPDIEATFGSYRLPDMGIIVVFQKAYDIPYVAPLDVNTGTTTKDKTLAKRYWSVFRPQAFSELTRVGPHDSLPDFMHRKWVLALRSRLRPQRPA